MKNRTEFFQHHSSPYQSTDMKSLLKKAEKIARFDHPVLIWGEPGTEKELIARSIHSFSDRKKGPFIVLNCVELGGSLLEEELFGKSASRKGLLEISRQGTIFLDEIGDVGAQVQKRILDFLKKTDTLKPRFITGSDDSLKKKIKEGSFSTDLYHALSFETVEILPLRKRTVDIRALALYYLNECHNHLKSDLLGFDSEAMNILKKYDWPRNAKELKELVERSAISCTSSHIQKKDLPESLINNPAEYESSVKTFKQMKKEVLERFEKEYLENVLTFTSGNVTLSSKKAGMDRGSFQRLMRKYSIKSNGFKK